jgi:hypothetical protein
MHHAETRRRALEMLASGLSRREVCRQLDVGYNSTYRWEVRLEPIANRDIRCFRCDGVDPHPTYPYLLGQYLGDGHIAKVNRTTALRIYCCDDYPRIISEVASAMVQVSGSSPNFRQVKGARCTQVQSSTNHWNCMIPQHGPGMKHTRPIVLTGWQRDIVATNPYGLIRGLIQSDGCRAMNTIHRTLPSGVRTYSYPRYFFSNVSDDIRGIYTDALDLLGIEWKQNRWNSISVAKRAAVAALDQFVGPKY